MAGHGYERLSQSGRLEDKEHVSSSSIEDDNDDDLELAELGVEQLEKIQLANHNEGLPLRRSAPAATGTKKTTARMHVLYMCLAIALFIVGRNWPTAGFNRSCFDSTSSYSPAINDIKLDYHDQVFNNTLLQSNVYRQDAGPAVDEAWHQLGVNWNNMTITREQGLKTSIPPGSVRVQDEYGGGYMGMLEVFHQLHCLNLLRKALVFNYRYYLDKGEEEFFDGEAMVKLHVGHCLDMIRLQLMCSADVGIVPFVWVEKRQWMPVEDTKPHRLPRFNNTHKCRNFDAIRDWYMENQDPRPFDHKQWDPRPSEDMLESYQ